MPMRLRRTCARSAARSRRADRWSRSTSSPAAARDAARRHAAPAAGDRRPPAARGYRRALARYRYGPGVFKLDWALDGPIPWTRRGVARAGTVHLGGTLTRSPPRSEAASSGGTPERPFVLLVQQSLFDPTRAPGGQAHRLGLLPRPERLHRDMTDAIEAQVERFAPGFRDRILARSRDGPGGDGAAQRELRRRRHQRRRCRTCASSITRPVARAGPLLDARPRLYLCSSSTPPGGGVHGMCGYFAARSALRATLSLTASKASARSV